MTTEDYVLQTRISMLRILLRIWQACLAIPFLKSLIGNFAFEQKLGEFPTLRLAFKRHDIP